MISFLYSCEKTNALRPMPWNVTNDPFPALRGQGAAHYAFFPFLGITPNTKVDCSTVYLDEQFSKIITTVKGTKLLVPAAQNEDELLLFITFRGGFRGGFSNQLKTKGVEVISEKWSSKHCTPTGHGVYRLASKEDWLSIETGRRCSVGEVEIFGWNSYKHMKSVDFNTWLELHGGRENVV